MGAESGFTLEATKVSRFLVVEPVSRNSPHFTVNERNQNWDGEKMYGTLMVTADVIEVFRATLLRIVGETPSDPIEFPSKETLDALLAPNKTAGSLSVLRFSPLAVSHVMEMLQEKPMDVDAWLKNVYKGTWIPKSEKPKPQQ
ncbi:hypothetical protein [Deinococcus roseus]|uniref:Uncharacterized protein n=1 Tax=Deinococcus roseus TaxID=392414 RepID=A0ABQ2D8Q5_9DEIO|nr:hypothetical protein [Deinococcus roseus]GGJ47629.1 hypothetical protein GCM10008938_37020 [Deinococcus roseus]